MVRTLSILLMAFVLGALSPSASSTGPGEAGCPPVDAVVVDAYRPPPEPWMPGNRGLTYGTVAGAAVRAVEPGVVRFAGSIAGTGYVSVERPDGTRLTYSFLGTITVGAETTVTTGTVLGAAGDRPFQLGWRDGRTYRDPSPLVAAGCPRRHAVLVPVPSA